MSTSFRHNCLQSTTARRPNGKCLIIGEVAQSHDGSLGMAHAFIDAIADAGADAVKFQTHIAAEESTLDEPWRVKFSLQDETRFDYWRRMEFTEEQWLGLRRHAGERGLLFLSTPFSERAADLLSAIGMKVWKVASGEIGNLPLLEKIIGSGSPIILSSGMSSWEELDTAVAAIRQNGNALSVLQCTSAYPCPPENVGLNVLALLRERYDVPVGLSDHSGNIFAGLAAATLGAEVLEVHVALSRQMFGPDVRSSVTTAELAQLVEGVDQIERMTASPVNKDSVSKKFEDLRRIFTKSIVARENIPAGTTLTKHHLALKKPGTGLAADSLGKLIGCTLTRDVRADEMLTFNDVQS